jgi:hypothetical protein
MILGIMSDTHGQHRRASLAIATLRARGMNYLIHCGDVGSAAVMEEMAAAGVPCGFVRGNCDDPEIISAAHAAVLGLTMAAPAPLALELDGRSVQVYHGHERAFAALWDKREPLSAGERPAVVLSGHTHVATDQLRGARRFINPGALQRAARYTVALLDLGRDRLEFVEIA